MKKEKKENEFCDCEVIIISPDGKVERQKFWHKLGMEDMFYTYGGFHNYMFEQVQEYRKHSLTLDCLPDEKKKEE